MQRIVGAGRYPLFKSSAFAALSLVAVGTSPALAWNLSSRSSSSSITRALLFSSSLSATSRLFSSVNAMSNDGTCKSSSFQVAQFPCLSDNYGYLVHDEATGHTAAVDTPEAAAYKKELEKRGWTLTHIFNTHHHWDHVGGNQDLKQKNKNVQVYGPASEKIPERDVGLNGGDEIEFGNSKVRIMDVGGHTRGHIAYYFPEQAKVFAGDSLFALGCGKMFEGTPAQFWKSLQGLRELPDETLVYCAHEYTASNANFAVSVEPGNAELMARVEEIKKLRERGQPTVPSLMGVERKTNPFLRCDVSEEIRRNVGVVGGDTDADAFGKVRRAKDDFRG